MPGRIETPRYFLSEREARDHAAEFEAEWGGATSPYEPRALVVPPNDDRPTWLVIASRRSSAE